LGNNGFTRNGALEGSFDWWGLQTSTSGCGLLPLSFGGVSYGKKNGRGGSTTRRQVSAKKARCHSQKNSGDEAKKKKNAEPKSRSRQKKEGEKPLTRQKSGRRSLRKTLLRKRSKWGRKGGYRNVRGPSGTEASGRSNGRRRLYKENMEVEDHGGGELNSEARASKGTALRAAEPLESKKHKEAKLSHLISKNKECL